jgi:hypothetical protein
MKWLLPTQQYHILYGLDLHQIEKMWREIQKLQRFQSTIEIIPTAICNVESTRSLDHGS